MKKEPASFLRKKITLMVILAAAAAFSSQTQAATVVDTWSSAGGAWTAANTALIADGITSGTWANSTNWTNAGLTPHSFSFSADTGSTGGSTLGVAGQTASPFASAANYFNTIANVSPTFNVVSGSALSGVSTISLTIIARPFSGGGPHSISDAPSLYFNGGATGLAATSQATGVSSLLRPGSTSNYSDYITFNWDVTSLDVESFSIDWTAGSIANFVQHISLTQTAVPEPSAFAALAGLVTLGFAALRRRRRA